MYCARIIFKVEDHGAYSQGWDSPSYSRQEDIVEWFEVGEHAWFGPDACGGTYVEGDEDGVGVEADGSHDVKASLCFFTCGEVKKRREAKQEGVLDLCHADVSLVSF